LNFPQYNKVLAGIKSVLLKCWKINRKEKSVIVIQIATIYQTFEALCLIFIVFYV